LPPVKAAEAEGPATDLKRRLVAKARRILSPPTLSRL
jgi:hypothetical protein